MQLTIQRLKIVFLVIFAISSVGVFAYHYYYVWPRDRCESAGRWWEPKGRVCAQPILLPKLTGRPFGAPPLATPYTSRDTAADLVAPGDQRTSPPR
jgi:hypothetical protein